MATTRAPTPDPATLASLHAALDGVVEIEALFPQMFVPLRRMAAAKRLRFLAREMRTLLVDLLRADVE